MDWETLDLAALLARREEATMSANAGPYAGPIGGMQRRIPGYNAPSEYRPCTDPGRFCELTPMGEGYDIWYPYR